jgi:hypothetical protein
MATSTMPVALMDRATIGLGYLAAFGVGAWWITRAG